MHRHADLANCGRSKFAGVLTAIILLVASSASAQAFEKIDIVGSPIGLVETPVLTPGACYEIQTINLSLYADPIMSIRTGASDLDSTIAGADGCETPGGNGQIAPACARFCVNAATFPTARSFTVWLRGYSTSTRGSVTLRIQRVTNMSVFPGASDCLFIPGFPPPPASSGCWTAMTGSVSFGGLIVDVSRPTGWFQIETTERPGIQAGAGYTSSHIIVFAGDNNDTALNWRIGASGHSALLGSGAPGSHRNHILATAQYSGTVPPSVPSSANMTVIAAPYGGTGTFRLLRNDFVYDTAARAGTDGDNDGLGPALEALLYTCDTAASLTQGGLSCASLPSCTTTMTTPETMSTACKQSMRDSDQDGLRDDIETYGVQLYNPGPIDGGYLARYGANPAHYDVFVEVDYRGTPSAGGCGNPVTSLTRTQAIAMASQHASATSALFPNRSGGGGISMHFDIGGLSTTDPPLSTDTAAGDWGGSNCYLDNPPCTTDAMCGGIVGSCCTAPTGCVGGQNTCTVMDARNVYMSSARRWLFFSVADINNGAGGGGTTIFGMQGYAGGAAAIVHESGHQGGLDHNGPFGTGMTTLANLVVNRPSIMNYLYSYVAGTMFTTPYPYEGAGTPTRVTFSSGSLPSLRPLALTEVVPLGPTADYDLIGRLWGSPFRDEVTNFGLRQRVIATPLGQSIDFNEDDQVTPASQTVEGRTGGGTERLGRAVIENPGAETFVSEGGPELVQVGSTMFRLRVMGVSNGATIAPYLTKSSSTTFSCSETPQAAPLDRYPSCPFIGGSFHMSTVPVSAVAVAADSTIVGLPLGVNAPHAVVVYRTGAGAYSHGVLAADGTWTPRGAIPSTPSLPLLPTGIGFPSVARIGGTNRILLTYKSVAGDILEQVGTFVNGTSAWTAPATVLSSGWNTIGSPATTTLENTMLGTDGVLMMTARYVGGVFTWEFRSRAASGAWTLVASLPQPGDGMWGRPVIEVRPFRVGSTASVDRLIISWRSTTSPTRLDTYTRMSPRNTLVGWTANQWTTANVFVDLIEPTAHAAEMQMDTRFALRGLRGSWTSAKTCNVVTPTCPSGSTCSPIAGGSSTPAVMGCVTPDGLIQGTERLTPGADGVQPIIESDFNEWPMLRAGYCFALRQEGSLTNVTVFGQPFLGRGWAPTQYRETSASCAPIPTYAR